MNRAAAGKGQANRINGYRGMSTITTRELAEALGLSTRAVNLRANNQSWPATDEVTRGGGKTYTPAALPLTDKEWRKVSRYLLKKAREQAAPAVLQAPLQVKNMEDLGQLRAAIRQALPLIGKEGLLAMLHTANALLAAESGSTGIAA